MKWNNQPGGIKLLVATVNCVPCVSCVNWLTGEKVIYNGPFVK